MILRTLLAVAMLGLLMVGQPALAQTKASCQSACETRCSGSSAKGNCIDRCVASCSKRN